MMKMNLQMGIAFAIALITLPLFIYLAAIKDDIPDYLVFCYPVLVCIMSFGAGLFASVKTGLLCGLSVLSLLLALCATGFLFNDLLRITPPYGGIAAVLISFYTAYIVTKKLLPKLLKTNLSADKSDQESQNDS